MISTPNVGNVDSLHFPLTDFLCQATPDSPPNHNNKVSLLYNSMDSPKEKDFFKMIIFCMNIYNLENSLLTILSRKFFPRMLNTFEGQEPIDYSWHWHFYIMIVSILSYWSVFLLSSQKTFTRLFWVLTKTLYAIWYCTYKLVNIVMSLQSGYESDVSIERRKPS